MIRAYDVKAGRLVLLPPEADLAQALWLDVLCPDAAEAARLAALGLDLPSLADMEEIELSNRLYHEGETHVMTVVATGQTEAGARIMAPLSFMLMPERLVTVRYHSPRPMDTYPPRAERSSAGLGGPAAVFLGLAEEMVGRLADHLEETGRGLDAVSALIHAEGTSSDQLHHSLRRIGKEGEMLAHLRLAMLTLGRAVSFAQGLPVLRPLAEVVATLSRDLAALEVHADFLSGRLALVSDACLGMIDLAQNSTVRIVSVVSVLFLPPTLIASIYGMNFAMMPELAQPWGYPVALLLMIGSALASWGFFKWKRWL